VTVPSLLSCSLLGLEKLPRLLLAPWWQRRRSSSVCGRTLELVTALKVCSLFCRSTAEEAVDVYLDVLLTMKQVADILDTSRLHGAALVSPVPSTPPLLRRQTCLFLEVSSSAVEDRHAARTTSPFLFATAVRGPSLVRSCFDSIGLCTY
jgi:hypothetical protein